MNRLILACFLLLLPANAADMTLFINGDMSAWQYQTYGNLPETSYQTAGDGGQHALIADNNGNGASGYMMEREINLQATPWLHFLWRVDTAKKDNPKEKTKAGDDYALRLYFITRSGLRYRTLNLVYAQNAAAGEIWKSPYNNFLSDIRLYAFASSNDTQPEKWQVSTVNLYELWQESFARDEIIKMVGIMTDGDNTNYQMKARYGALVLSDSPAPLFK